MWWTILTKPVKMALGGLVAALVALLAILGYGRSRENEGASKALSEALIKDEEKRGKAREAAFKEKRDVDGLSDSDLVDRLRRRGDDWGGL